MLAVGGGADLEEAASRITRQVVGVTDKRKLRERLSIRSYSSERRRKAYVACCVVVSGYWLRITYLLTDSCATAERARKAFQVPVRMSQRAVFILLIGISGQVRRLILRVSLAA